MHTVKRTSVRFCALSAVSAFCLLGSLSLSAQTAPVPAAADQAADNKEETVVLSPFVVTTDNTAGYAAKDTLAGTRVRTELKDVASAISVVTKQFLTDTGAKNSQDLLVYTTNTEVGGIYGNFSGVGGSSTYNEASNLLRPSNNTRVRGLDSADNTRDYFLTEIPWDGYNVDRVDMQRGPNSILFGVGSPAGIINTSLNGASFKNANKIENRVDKYGSLRDSVDLNYVVRKNELAIRFAAVDENTKYQQKPAFNHDKRAYGALRFDPQLFGEGSHTTFRANVENGNIRANRPRSLPPIDGITPWFKTGSSFGFPNLNKLTLDPLTSWNQYGNNPAYPGYTLPGLGTMGRFFSADVANFYNANNSSPLFTQTPNINTAGGVNTVGIIDGTIGGFEFSRPAGIVPYNTYARAAIPGGKYYSNVSLSDPSIFDFYNQLIDGSNKHEYQKWDAANLALQQTFFHDRVGFEASYDFQRYKDGQESVLGGDNYEISIDINSKLVDGSANPNVGRPYVSNSGQYGNAENSIKRDSARFTAFGDLRAEDWLGRTTLARFLGHHVFTGLLSQDTKRTDYRAFSRWASDATYAISTNQSTDITNGARQYDWTAYLGPSLMNAASPANAHLNNITANLAPAANTTLRYFDSHWKGLVDPGAPYTYITHDSAGNPVTNTGTQSDNPANYVGWTSGTFKMLSADNGNIGSLYTSGQKSINKIKSGGLTWQGYFWDGNIVPVFGWRKDKVTNASTAAKKDGYQVSLMRYSVDTSAANTQEASGNSHSWGVVVHTPEKYRDLLPGGTHLSLFVNNSRNFKADAPRGDVFGNIIPNPDGQTKDYGVVISTLHDKLSLKLNWYETKVQNATLQADSAGFSSSLYYVWALPYWGATHALAALDGIANPQLRQGSWGWPWNNIAVNADGTPNTTRINAIVSDFFKNFPLTQNFADQYGLGMNVAAMHAATNATQMYASVPTYGLNSAGVYDPIGGSGASGLGLQPLYAGALKSTGSGPVASVDTTSKGLEMELTAQPTKNWNVSFNAAKTNASRTGISPTIQAWIASYTKFLAGDAGLIQLWGGDTIRKVWADNVVAPYSVLLGQVGSQAPEVAPWRFNVVSNYNFDSGTLKGSNAGLAYRWEDKRILGYKYDKTTDTLDIKQPWYGPTDKHVDLWVGYGRKITKSIYWRAQINLRNVGEHAHLTPVNLQPDGSVALSRIQEGMTWQLTNTFSF